MSIYEEDYFNPELWLEYKSHSIAETLDHVVFNGVHLAILDELPKPGVRYEGTLYSFDRQFRSAPVPAELIEIVKEEI